MSNTKRKVGATTPPTDYLFDDSGLPEDIKYLGDISVSAAADQPFIVVGDWIRQEYGRLPLSGVAAAAGFQSALTSAGSVAKAVLAPPTGTASAYPTAGQISFGFDAVLSAVTVFVKTPAGGKSLSGVLLVGQVASATAWTNVLGPTI